VTNARRRLTQDTPPPTTDHRRLHCVTHITIHSQPTDDYTASLTSPYTHTPLTITLRHSYHHTLTHHQRLHCVTHVTIHSHTTDDYTVSLIPPHTHTSPTITLRHSRHHTVTHHRRLHCVNHVTIHSHTTDDYTASLTSPYSHTPPTITLRHLHRCTLIGQQCQCIQSEKAETVQLCRYRCLQAASLINASACQALLAFQTWEISYIPEI